MIDHMTEVISKDEELRVLERRMEKQPMDDEYLFGVYNGLKCARGIIEALPSAASQTAQAAVHAADRRLEDMKRLTYMDGGKWRIRLGDTEYSGTEVDYIAAIEDMVSDCNLDRLQELVEADRDGRIKIDPQPMQCPKCGKYMLFPRVDWQYYYCFACKSQFTARQIQYHLCK